MGKAIIKEEVYKRKNEQGEIIEEVKSKSWTFSKSTEPFFLTYINCIAWMYNLKSITVIKVLYKLLEISDFNTNRVDISTNVRRTICSALGISDTSFSKAINQLVKLSILDGEKGSYTIAEEIFWKGDYKTRETLLKSKAKMTFEAIQPDEEFETEKAEEN